MSKRKVITLSDTEEDELIIPPTPNKLRKVIVISDTEDELSPILSPDLSPIVLPLEPIVLESTVSPTVNNNTFTQEEAFSYAKQIRNIVFPQTSSSVQNIQINAKVYNNAQYNQNTYKSKAYKGKERNESEKEYLDKMLKQLQILKSTRYKKCAVKYCSTTVRIRSRQYCSIHHNKMERRMYSTQPTDEILDRYMNEARCILKRKYNALEFKEYDGLEYNTEYKRKPEYSKVLKLAKKLYREDNMYM